jgi:TetR/AcrR family acrAB operon transcriptional repressor
MVRRTKEEALATRMALLDAAERVFSERGVSRTSLSDVAAAAGVTRGAVYWHFKDKVDLLDAMLRRVVLPMEEAQAACTGSDPAGDPLGHLRNCLLKVLKRTATDPQSQRVFEIVFHKCEYIDEMAPARDRCAAMREGYLSEIERGLRNAIKQGQLPSGVRVRTAATGLHALVDGLIANWVQKPDYFALEREAAHVIDMFLDGLRAAGRPAGKAGGAVVSLRNAHPSRPIGTQAHKRPVRRALR